MLNNQQKEFIKLMHSVAYSRSVVDVFSDFCHMAACALWSPCVVNAKERQEVEADFERTRKNYTDEQYKVMQQAFAIVSQYLEYHREEFLGSVLEEIGASNKHNGQFLTPQCISRFMAKCLAPSKEDAASHKPGEIIPLNDPACGASVLLIEGAEQLRQAGIPQRDIFVIAGDIDRRACDMSYIQLSLLGYSAKVEHMDALSRTVYSPPRYTIGYFLHAFPMRGVVHGRLPAKRTETPVEEREETAPIKDISETETPVEAAVNAPLTQGVFAF